jgi:hypothetical protein
MFLRMSQLFVSSISLLEAWTNTLVIDGGIPRVENKAGSSRPSCQFQSVGGEHDDHEPEPPPLVVPVPGLPAGNCNTIWKRSRGIVTNPCEGHS